MGCPQAGRKGTRVCNNFCRFLVGLCHRGSAEQRKRVAGKSIYAARTVLAYRPQALFNVGHGDINQTIETFSELNISAPNHTVKNGWFRFKRFVIYWKCGIE